MVVNDKNEVIGSASRKEMREKVLWHRASFIFLVNSKDQMYVHLRHKNKLWAPHHWDLVFGGCVE